MANYFRFVKELITEARPLKDRETLTPLIDSLKDKKIVMLGEASHGTREFYEWRQLITEELIENHGFNFICVEGDWPPCQRINDFVLSKTQESAHSVLGNFTRWPTWMWANAEILSFIDLLRDWNIRNGKVGFHGLDVYSLYESADRVIALLDKLNPELADMARKKYSCLNSYGHDEKAYARALLKTPLGCQREILDVLHQTLKNRLVTDEWFDVEQNSLIVKNAEEYYRAMVFSEGDSWNLRDQHMMETLEKLLHKYGPESKAIVWAHNTHVGDYRATDMMIRKQINIGGLAREIYGQDKVGLVGFGTFSGSVLASNAWDGPSMRFDLPEAFPGSLEYEFHSVIANIGSPDFFLLLNETHHHLSFSQVLGHRAVGVVYDPDFEHFGNYVPTSLANRYDAFIFLDHTHALTPLDVSFDAHKIPDTYPFGDKY